MNTSVVDPQVTAIFLKPSDSFENASSSSSSPLPSSMNQRRTTFLVSASFLERRSLVSSQIFSAVLSASHIQVFSLSLKISAATEPVAQSHEWRKPRS